MSEDPAADDAVDVDVASSGRPRSRAATFALGALVLAVGLASGLLLAGTLLRPAVATEGSADAGFARDMQVHHAQAVEMSVLVRERTTDPAVRSLALDIELTQQHQQGQMFGWLSTWGLPNTSAQPPMTWAGHGHAEGQVDGQSMPGLVDDEQMARLEAATGAEADRIYLALMIPHHEGGVAMAEIAVEEASRPEVRRLADAIVRSQEAELQVLHEMLEERGGPPGDL